MISRLKLLGALSAISLVVGLAMASKKPELTLRVFPIQGFPPLHVTVRAEVKGDLTEEWRCPEVIWDNPDGTQSRELSDCDDASGPPTSWHKHYNILVPGEWEFTVTLMHNRKLLDRRTIVVTVLGS